MWMDIFKLSVMRTPQRPIHSTFSSNSTAAEVAAGHDLKGKIAVVTGGNSGIGYEIVKTLSGAGATVVVGARDAGKAGAWLSDLENVSFKSLDLADPVSVDQFAERFFASHDRVHLLFNNAGLMRPSEFMKDKRGYELQFGVNHLGHFQLTGRLWPALKKAGGARVVVTSSVGHRSAGVDLSDPNFERHDYDKARAYARSKTANSLFAVELDGLGKAQSVRAFAVHPGAILTDIFRYMDEEEREVWVRRVRGQPGGANFKTPQQGAATAIWCALSEQLDGMGGVYCEDCNIAELLADDDSAGHGVRSFAIDEDIATELWQLSETAVGFKWPY
jgi:NAD(P)-dependent dehydrogenase (short-subunit alcohol dehydrogenase family)